MRWLLPPFLLVLAAAGTGSASHGPTWEMLAEPCATPGLGSYRTSLERDALEGRWEGRVRGSAECPGYSHSVNYWDIPMTPQADGTWLFSSPPWRLHLTADGGLIAFDDWNDFLGSEVLFRPVG